MPEITDLHEPFMVYLMREKIPFIRARSDQESTIALGHPDFTLLHGNRTLMIEFKFEKGALSMVQKKRIEELKAAGCSVYVVRDISPAIELVNAWRSEVTVPFTEQDKKHLGRFNGWVWVNNGPPAGWVHLRKETPQDAAIPSLR